MKVKYVHLDRQTHFAFETPVAVKDSCGFSWTDVCGFKVDGFSGKSVYIIYYGRDGIRLFRGLKRLSFKEDGKLYCKVCNQEYCVGTWEIKEQ